MTELEAEQEMTRTEVADYLREFARQLDTAVPEVEPIGEGEDPTDGRVTFMVGNNSTTINPPETVEFEVSIGSDSELLGAGEEQEVEFELSWETTEAETADDEDPLEIK